MDRKEQLVKIFPRNIKEIFLSSSLDFKRLQEIRLRINRPIIINYNNKEYYITKDGQLEKNGDRGYIVSRNEMRETMEFVSSYSLYAYEEEIKQGFITIQGGHRVGLAGKVVLDGQGIKFIKYISFINIRLSHEKIGCANNVLPFLVGKEGIKNTLIISPPRAGKTTLLRDIVRQCSNGNDVIKGMSVGVVDERSEIGACYMGEPQNDLGIRTDVLDSCPKAMGIMMLIRTMAPELIAVDEIGTKEDIEAISYGSNCGCSIIATIHGNSLEDLEKKPIIKEMIEKKLFSRFVILSGNHSVGTISHILDEHKNIIYQ